MTNDNGNAQTKALNAAALADSVQTLPPADGGGFGGAFLTLSLAHEADEIPRWGTNVVARDRALREFWPSTPEIAGPIATLAARNAVMTVNFDGPTRTVDAAQQLATEANHGAGLANLVTMLSLDVYTQDKGGFLETPRESYVSGEAALARVNSGKPLPPVTALSHLDAACCQRTGNPINPVIYLDPISGKRHLLPWHMVVSITEMPSPIKMMRGLQYSALTRVLSAAQLMRDFNIFAREKVGGRNPSEIQIVGGPSTQAITDAIARASERADNRGLLRYMEPIIVASLDPTKPVTAATIGWASLPDGFNPDEALKSYITKLAMGLLEDYQTFAPLPGGGLGTSTQSDNLARKGRGKGPAVWQKLLTHVFNFCGIFPRTIYVSYRENDPIADKEEADATASKLKNVIDMTTAGIMTVPVARQYCADNDILINEEYLAMLGDEDATPDESTTDEERVDTTGDIDVLAGNGAVLTVAGGDADPAQVQAVPGEAPAAGGADVQSLALNGSQVTSLLEIVAMYSRGELTLTSATGIITAAFPALSPAVVGNILNVAGANPADEPSQDAVPFPGVDATKGFFAPFRSRFGAQHATHKRTTPKPPG